MRNYNIIPFAAFLFLGMVCGCKCNKFAYYDQHIVNSAITRLEVFMYFQEIAFSDNDRYYDLSEFEKNCIIDKRMIPEGEYKYIDNKDNYTLYLICNRPIGKTNKNLLLKITKNGIYYKLANGNVALGEANWAEVDEPLSIAKYSDGKIVKFTRYNVELQ